MKFGTENTERDLIKKIEKLDLMLKREAEKSDNEMDIMTDKEQKLLSRIKELRDIWEKNYASTRTKKE